jgi:hypothetical protein
MQHRGAEQRMVVGDEQGRWGHRHSLGHGGPVALRPAPRADVGFAMSPDLRAWIVVDS